MSPSTPDLLRHILEEADYLLRESAALTRNRFLADESLQRAFVRSLEIIGEATKRLPPDFRSAAPEIDWRGMAGMRDRLIHGYFAVDYELVWDVVEHEIPRLRPRLRQLLG